MSLQELTAKAFAASFRESVAQDLPLMSKLFGHKPPPPMSATERARRQIAEKLAAMRRKMALAIDPSLTPDCYDEFAEE